MLERDWYGLYGEGWQGEILPEAFAHPAKFSRRLIRRIYQHAIEQSWLAEGDTCLDPFGGVALGGLDALYNGLHWVGVELEEKFVALGQQNIDLWNSRYAALPRWGSAVILQGDSRRLVEVLDGARAQGVIASPPYADQDVAYIKSSMGDAHKRIGTVGHRNQDDGYSINPSNLGNMPAGDAPVVNGVIGSPPYAQSLGNGKSGIDWSKQADRETSHPHGWAGENYGFAPGQLAAMPEGVAGVVSSPPYERAETRDRTSFSGGRVAAMMPYAYTQDKQGVTEGNLSNSQGDTFWSAARQIVGQCWQVLVPGGVAIFVLKSFIRKGQVVDFPGQWRELCESCGFETVEVIRAWLVEDRGAQYALSGDLEERRMKRASFFRRLYENKYPENSIDYEIVLCTRKSTERNLT
jgi:hypothetical protein